jgi:hypothetical protein
MRDGRYITERKRCSGGALATWAPEFLSKFTLKKEVYHTLTGKLASNSREGQDYVLELFFWCFDFLEEKPARYLQTVLIKGLKPGDSRFKQAIEGLDPWGGKYPWDKQLREALAAFKPAEPALMEGEPMDDDDVPF